MLRSALEVLDSKFLSFELRRTENRREWGETVRILELLAKLRRLGIALDAQPLIAQPVRYARALPLGRSL